MHRFGEDVMQALERALLEEPGVLGVVELRAVSVA